MSDLTPKQERFCREYIIDLNGTQAAIRAGFSENTARSQASDMLAEPHISERIKALQEKVNAKLEITAEDVVAEVWKVAKLDLAKCYDAGGKLLNIHDIPEETRAALAGIDVDELWEQGADGKEQVGVTRKLKLWDKMKALDLMGKRFKLWTDKADVNVQVDLGAIIDAAKGLKRD